MCIIFFVLRDIRYLHGFRIVKIYELIPIVIYRSASIYQSAHPSVCFVFTFYELDLRSLIIWFGVYIILMFMKCYSNYRWQLVIKKWCFLLSKNLLPELPRHFTQYPNNPFENDLGYPVNAQRCFGNSINCYKMTLFAKKKKPSFHNGKV